MAVPAPQALQQARLARALPKLRADETRNSGRALPADDNPEHFTDLRRRRSSGPWRACDGKWPFGQT